MSNAFIATWKVNVIMRVHHSLFFDRIEESLALPHGDTWLVYAIGPLAPQIECKLVFVTLRVKNIKERSVFTSVNYECTIIPIIPIMTALHCYRTYQQHYALHSAVPR